MANILINGLKAKTGGGKNILDNFIANLNKCKTVHSWFILTPNASVYKVFEREDVSIIDVQRMSKHNIFFPWLYFVELPGVLKKLKIDVVFNFGDVIIPGFYNQIYFFDWAYAVYPEKYIWRNMTLLNYFIRKTKVILIKRSIHKVKITIAQTNNMAVRLEKYYKINDVVVIPTPVGKEFLQSRISKDFDLPRFKRKFLFPASFSSHKNFDVIIPLGEIIKSKRLPFTIVLTIDHNNQTKEFFKKIEDNNLDCIISVGKLNNDIMPSLYKQCDALLLPTLLESYGLPYVEAMAYGLPIVTSDLDFAHEVCNDIAFYFDPFDPISILKSMEECLKDKDETKKRVIAGQRLVSLLPNWESVFAQFHEQIDLAIK